jgi:hypothetical protein
VEKHHVKSCHARVARRGLGMTTGYPLWRDQLLHRRCNAGMTVEPVRFR